MPDFTVKQFGEDSSGRPIFMTAFMAAWWEGIVRELGFRPTIVQGAWMSRVPGGGAADSAGYHDGGGCLDLRVWDLTQTQQKATIHATRWGGAGSWVRDEKHGGMDSHIHLVLGADYGLSPGASWQWLNYLGGGDGIGGRDYHPRPNPMVAEPPASLMEDDMAFRDWPKDDQTALVDAVAAAVVKRLLDTDLTPKVDEPKSTVRAALNQALKLGEAFKRSPRS